MRGRVLLLVLLLTLGLVASASGSHAKPKLVRIVRHEGAFTATLTYTQHKTFLFQFFNVTLRVDRNGHVLLNKKICQHDPYIRGKFRCAWGPTSSASPLSVRRVGPGHAAAFLVNLWNGGNQCCEDTFIVVPKQRTVLLRREWSGAAGWSDTRIARVRGRNVFVSGDGRFFCNFSSCAGAAVPIEVWKIDSALRLVNVTRRYPGLIRRDAQKLASLGFPQPRLKQQGSGVLAAWCADEYLLGNGPRCSRILAYALRHHPPNMEGAETTRWVVRTLNRDLARWGYKRSN